MEVDTGKAETLLRLIALLLLGNPENIANFVDVRTEKKGE